MKIDSHREFPIVDLFAGPGGLSEGFAAFESYGNHPFDIRLSIEMDETACQTLMLRGFFRKLIRSGNEEDYYRFLRDEISLETLYLSHPALHKEADDEVWQHQLGTDRKAARQRIGGAVAGFKEWALLGGPPCQAYSLVGRSRMKTTVSDFDSDHRHFLYKEYLQILADHRPTVFVFENVKGLLSSIVNGKSILDNIVDDLSAPGSVLGMSEKDDPIAYTLFSFVDEIDQVELHGDERKIQHKKFIIRCEQFGIPQARHRLIILGVRTDWLDDNLGFTPGRLKVDQPTVSVGEAIGDLPRLRSRFSKGEDSSARWSSEVFRMAGAGESDWQSIIETNPELSDVISEVDRLVSDGSVRPSSSGGKFVKNSKIPRFNQAWIYDSKLGGTLNHETRGHIEKDLDRYLFVSSFGKLRGKTPTLDDFPSTLLPKHKNAIGNNGNRPFVDRFKVQVGDRPSSTITSHISKDGHYFIHYDPSQCRSFTVREAARLQTFPDNYFFQGGRTSQYVQVGNAVPPLLAVQLAEVAYKLLSGGH